MSEVIEFWSSGPMICCPLTMSRFPPEDFFQPAVITLVLVLFFGLFACFLMLFFWHESKVWLPWVTRFARAFLSRLCPLGTTIPPCIIPWQKVLVNGMEKFSFTIHKASWDIDMDKTKVFGTLFITLLKIFHDIFVVTTMPSGIDEGDLNL